MPNAESLNREREATIEHIVEENDLLHLQFICFTFHSKNKAQTLAIVLLEMVPQGRSIPLDKHLEEKAWQEAFPKNFLSRFSMCAASYQPHLSEGI